MIKQEVLGLARDAIINETNLDGNKDDDNNGDINMKQQIHSAVDQVMANDGVKKENKSKIELRLVLSKMRKNEGFNILGACTPGTFSDDVRKIVDKLLIDGQIFGKLVSVRVVLMVPG